MINCKYVMQKRNSGEFFVKMRPNTGLGDMLTHNLNEAAIYNNEMPMGFRNTKDKWKSIRVKVIVTIA